MHATHIHRWHAAATIDTSKALTAGQHAITYMTVWLMAEDVHDSVHYGIIRGGPPKVTASVSRPSMHWMSTEPRGTIACEESGRVVAAPRLEADVSGRRREPKPEADRS